MDWWQKGAGQTIQSWLLTSCHVRMDAFLVMHCTQVTNVSCCLASRQCVANHWTQRSPARWDIAMPNVNINAPVGSKALSNGFGTVTGNKSFGTQNCVIDEVVFLQSTQCIPLIRFPSSLVPNQSKGEIPGVLPPWVEKMQKVVDDFFNNDSYPTSLNIKAISQQQPEKCCCH